MFLLSVLNLGRCRRLVALGLLGNLLLLGGCSAAYRDSQARTPGELTDDIAIGAKVKTKLLADDEISGLRINVDVRVGVVTLRGRVSSNLLLQRAVALATGVKGVARVDNQLTVRTQPSERSDSN